jgi:transcriptional regulator with XRE-family HTH domain
LSVVHSGVAFGAGYSLLMRSEPPLRPALLRELIGESLREERVAQGKTLREVSKAAQVSLGYLSEVERGQKEASSELLAAMCAALDLPLSVVLNLVSEKLALVESAADDRVTALPRVRALAQAAA